MNITLLLEMARDGAGDRVAVGDAAAGLTYATLHERSRRAATVFGRSAAAHVDYHVGYLAVNGETFPVALFGAAFAGIPFVPLNYRLAAEPMRALLDRIAPACVLIDGSQPVGTDDDDHRTLTFDAFATELDAVEPVADGEAADGDGVAVLLFTSGTTGVPKAAVLRHRHLVAYILGSVEFMGAAEEEAALVCVPPYHVAAVASTLSSIYAGRRIVHLPTFDADRWIDLANDQRVTHAMVVPTMLDRIVARLEARGTGIPTLRTLSYGGGRMASSTIERALDLMPSTGFVNAYGLTETSSTITLLDADDHRAAHRATTDRERRRLVSVGRPIPNVEVSIRDELGTPLGADETGEVWVRGEQVAGEYVGRGSVLDADGWFHTNDEGSMDADGYLYVIGRLDDVIVRGGENISPGEIEAVLVEHEHVLDAACVGAPDDEWGEVVVAVVVRDPASTVDEHDLADFVKSRLRSSKVPARLVFVDELEYNETGKLLRRAVRERVLRASAG